MSGIYLLNRSLSGLGAPHSRPREPRDLTREKSSLDDNCHFSRVRCFEAKGFLLLRFVFVLAVPLHRILHTEELWGQGRKEGRTIWGRFHGGTSYTLHVNFITPGAKYELAKISSQGLLKYDGGSGGKTACHG